MTGDWRPSFERILAETRSLDDARLRRLATAVRAETGWCGLRRAFPRALAEGQHALQSAWPDADPRQLADEALAATLDAAASLAEAHGRDSSDLRATAARYQADDMGRRPSQDLSRVLRRAVGIRMSGVVADASIGVQAASTAAATGDLTSTDGPYTPEMRALLLRPWGSALSEG